MRVDAAQRLDRHIGHAEQAVAHVDDLLADQGEVESQQQVVRLVDRSGGGVFDRQHRAIGVPFDHRLEHLLEGAVGLEAHRPLRDGEVLQRGLVAIGAFGALEGHRDLLRRVRGAGLQRILLPPHRIVEDLAEDAPHERRVEAEPLAKRRAMLQQRRLAIGIAHRPVAIGLHSRDLPRQPRPLAERRHQHRIDIVETLPKCRKVLIGHKKSRLRFSLGGG